jgi:hypothetical protein
MSASDGSPVLVDAVVDIAAGVSACLEQPLNIGRIINRTTSAARSGCMSYSIGVWVNRTLYQALGAVLRGALQAWRQV